MEYILAAFIALSVSGGGASNVNTALSVDTATQCINAKAAFEAVNAAKAECLVNGSRYSISLYAVSSDFAPGDIGLTSFATSGACATARDKFKARGSYARAACIAVPIGGRND